VLLGCLGSLRPSLGDRGIASPDVPGGGRVARQLWISTPTQNDPTRHTSSQAAPIHSRAVRVAKEVGPPRSRWCRTMRLDAREQPARSPSARLRLSRFHAAPNKGLAKSSRTQDSTTAAAIFGIGDQAFDQMPIPVVDGQPDPRGIGLHADAHGPRRIPRETPPESPKSKRALHRGYHLTVAIQHTDVVPSAEAAEARTAKSCKTATVGTGIK